MAKINTEKFTVFENLIEQSVKEQMRCKIFKQIPIYFKIYTV